MGKIPIHTMFPKHPRNHQFGNDDHQLEFTVTFLLENGPKSIISHNDGIILSEMMTAFYLLTYHPVEKEEEEEVVGEEEVEEVDEVVDPK